MTSQSNSTSSLVLDDSAGFELTDLGACSYLDSTRDRSPRTRTLTENLDSITTDRRMQRVSISRSISASASGVWKALGAESNSVSARPVRPRDASVSSSRSGEFSVVRPPSEEATVLQFRIPAAPSDEPREHRPSGESTRIQDGLALASTESDRLDEALADFLGADVSTSANRQALEQIYGGVFDPEERARELSRTEVERIASGNTAVVPPEESGFDWDDDELDEPIDPDEVRRRLGRRAEDSPRFTLLRKFRRRARRAGGDGLSHSDSTPDSDGAPTAGSDDEE